MAQRQSMVRSAQAVLGMIDKCFTRVETCNQHLLLMILAPPSLSLNHERDWSDPREAKRGKACQSLRSWLWDFNC